MTVNEIPSVFDCEGDALISVAHVPDTVKARGVLAIVAGGPQYRGGVGRLQVKLARELAADGIPVMRFDYRGLGDSEGAFRGFADVEADLRAALAHFRSLVPGMQEVVLWGGCDAASAILINAWKFPEVTGIMVGNPWVSNEDAGNAVMVKRHYSRRIREKEFWLKVLRLQFNPLPALATVARMVAGRLKQRLAPSRPTPAVAAGPTPDDPAAPAVPRMRAGLARFKGDMLLLMSGQSLVSMEFDEIVAADAAWQQAMTAPRSVTRHDLPDADQTYSTLAARNEIIALARAWLLDPPAARVPANS
ncbi:hydrolase 1, exosortase A system-associated [Denitromonas iodatirespirans]|uniref:Hydrolase 1, exosortase A system-associated n=1 Tax=Denitromonas iodatirespirans TaxID=2795389 RepID=A0A944DD76_DENI1|nr:hydrolase 1, exosortase A system-associated [Denitromonas iodatirespirans]MBT0960588.1 hydrolase 1, exosortase A system-associated [Denitromonas iodatirespirans]